MADVRRRRRRNQGQNVLIHRNLRDFENPIEIYGDEELVRRHYRLYPVAIYFVCALVSDDIGRDLVFGLPVLLQVCAALKFLGTGHFFLNVGGHNSLNISTSSAWRCTEAVTTSLARRLQQFVRFPVGQKLRDAQLSFQNRGTINGRAGIWVYMYPL